MTEVILGRRLYDFAATGSMGVVNDVQFIRCFWPRLAEPTRIFAPGSSGLIVQGPPTPRNVVFPDDTVFPDVSTDAENIAIDVFKAAGRGRGYVSNDPAQLQAYLDSYESEKAKLPVTATKIRCRSDCQFLVHNELISAEDEKPSFDRYVSELTMQEATDFCDGKIDRAVLNVTHDYLPISGGEETKYQIDADGKLIEKVQ